MSAALRELYGKSEGKLFQAKYRSVGTLLKCLCYDLF
jgi:hypothetical protein